MCWICDHPGATERDYQDHMWQLIKTFGWAVAGVERDGVRPPWAYTVGLTPFRRPELVITGICGLQLVHADKRGRWPWDRRYQGGRGGQPVLGTRAPAEQRSRVG